MLRITTTFDVRSEPTVQPPKSVAEAARAAWLYAVSGVPPAAQGGMRLSQALLYARQNNLARPSHDEVRAAYLRSLRP